jgi:hypothetical protein
LFDGEHFVPIVQLSDGDGLPGATAGLTDCARIFAKLGLAWRRLRQINADLCREH